MGARLGRWLLANYWLLVYSMCAGAFATCGGLLVAASVVLPFSPTVVWYGATAALSAGAGLLAGPVLFVLKGRGAGG
ncbi:hypothetical protein [Actinocrinis sp.]|uniref:hypothetical protein n=1 Tax=Actinocrinis sp. TaxID=1920516 RepID=UPI002D3DA52C|nr:hypothetical protein [Actinocrinis sp.]HZP53875.1 hypothetical protein [Actinocrinis sp.]